MDYLKSTGTLLPELHVNYDFKQSFLYEPQKVKSLNESMVIRDFEYNHPDTREVDLAIMKLLARFQFATTGQISRYLEYKGFEVENLNGVLKSLLERRNINFFIITPFKIPASDFPEDAEKIYCLHLGARYILTHYYREDFVYWKTTDNVRGAEIVIKLISTLEFYLALIQNHKANIRVFDPVFNAPIGGRDTRFSALIETQVNFNKRRFMLESVRGSDIPVFFQKKVADHIAKFLREGTYKKVVGGDSPPEFIFLCEDMEYLSEAADIYFRYFGKSDFFLTTDEEILKGIDDAKFYKYDGETLKEGIIKAFVDDGKPKKAEEPSEAPKKRGRPPKAKATE